MTTDAKVRTIQQQALDLPNVLVQDPVRECAYHLTAEQLGPFTATAERFFKMDDSTVTFVIPGGNELIDDVPPYLRNPELNPSILIRHPAGEKAYFLTFEELQVFKVPQPTEASAAGWVSFIIPKGTELIEELPALRRALMQTSTK